MKKALKWTLIIVPLLLIAVVVIVILSLDSIARSTIESQTAAQTKLPASLKSAHISLLGGEVGLKEFSIKAPAGFSSGEMFDLGKLDVKVSYSELTKQPIRISEIVVDSAKLVVEQNGGKINVYSAMQQMPKSESSSDMRLVIGLLQVKNTQVVVRPNLPFGQKEYAMTLPSVELKNIGTGEGAQNGAAIKDVIQLVLNAMMEKVNQSGKLPPQLTSMMTSGDIVGSAQAQVQQQVQSATQQAKDRAQQEIQKGLGDLLGGTKKK